MSQEEVKCYKCGKPAELICNNCNNIAICDMEDDQYCDKCGPEVGIWAEYKGKRAAKKTGSKKATGKGAEEKPKKASTKKSASKE